MRQCSGMTREGVWLRGRYRVGMGQSAERDLQRRVFVSTFRMSPFAAAVGAFFGWTTGGYSGAAVGAMLMALVAMPLAGLIGYGIAGRMYPRDR